MSTTLSRSYPASDRLMGVQPMPARAPLDEKSRPAPADTPFRSQAQVDRYASRSFPYAINPSFIRLLRLILYTLTSLSAIVTAVFAILVVVWYNGHDPSIKPSWGSDIALIVFGLGTPFPLLATLLITPRIVRRGGVAAPFVGQVRSELFLLFNLAVIWISGALAMAVDLRGYENCIWDGYYHWPQPASFRHVCDLRNYTVIMGYVTFGLVALQWAVVTSLAVYILLYLDQDTLTEPAHDMGGRAYRAHILAASLADSRPMAAGRPQEPFDEKAAPPPGGPMAGGRPLRGTDVGPESVFSTGGGPGPMAGGRPRPAGTATETDSVPRSPARQRMPSLDAREFDEEGLAEFARRPSHEAPRGVEGNGYYGQHAANPFENQ